MKKPIRAFIVLVLVATLIRWYLTFPSGAGRGVLSPSGRFIATADSLAGEKFWGGKFTYYNFTIETTNHDLICHGTLDNPRSPLSDWRDEGDKLIVWEADSSSVTYNFNGGHLNLSVTP